MDAPGRRCHRAYDVFKVELLKALACRELAAKRAEEYGLPPPSLRNFTLSCVGNLMIALRLFGHETDANHIREESRRSHLDLHDGLCDWRDDLATLTATDAQDDQH
jgi:hypothetical protein